MSRQRVLAQKATSMQWAPLSEIGEQLEDSGIILTDVKFVQAKRQQTFSALANRHRFEGACQGVIIIEAYVNGTIEKLACGDCPTLNRDGKTVFTLGSASDVVLNRNALSGHDAVLQGAPRSSTITLCETR